MTAWSGLDRFLATDPRDPGCDRAMQLLPSYVDVVDENGPGVAAERCPGVTAHLAACGPCGDDFHGLLAAIEADR